MFEIIKNTCVTFYKYISVACFASKVVNFARTIIEIISTKSSECADRLKGRVTPLQPKKTPLEIPNVQSIDPVQMAGMIQNLEGKVDDFIRNLSDPWDYRLTLSELISLFELIISYSDKSLHYELITPLIDKLSKNKLIDIPLKLGYFEGLLKKYKSYREELIQGDKTHFSEQYQSFCINQVLVTPLEYPIMEKKWSLHEIDMLRDGINLLFGSGEKIEYPSFEYICRILFCPESYEIPSNLSWPRIRIKDSLLCTPMQVWDLLNPNNDLKMMGDFVSYMEIITNKGGSQSLLERAQQKKMTLREYVFLRTLFSNKCFHEMLFEKKAPLSPPVQWLRDLHTAYLEFNVDPRLLDSKLINRTGWDTRGVGKQVLEAVETLQNAPKKQFIEWSEKEKKTYVPLLATITSSYLFENVGASVTYFDLLSQSNLYPANAFSNTGRDLYELMCLACAAFKPVAEKIYEEDTHLFFSYGNNNELEFVRGVVFQEGKPYQQFFSGVLDCINNRKSILNVPLAPKCKALFQVIWNIKHIQPDRIAWVNEPISYFGTNTIIRKPVEVPDKQNFQCSHPVNFRALSLFLKDVDLAGGVDAYLQNLINKQISLSQIVNLFSVFKNVITDCAKLGDVEILSEHSSLYNGILAIFTEYNLLDFQNEILDSTKDIDEEKIIYAVQFIQSLVASYGAAQVDCSHWSMEDQQTYINKFHPIYNLGPFLRFYIRSKLSEDARAYLEASPHLIKVCTRPHYENLDKKVQFALVYPKVVKILCAYDNGTLDELSFADKLTPPELLFLWNFHKSILPFTPQQIVELEKFKGGLCKNPKGFVHLSFTEIQKIDMSELKFIDRVRVKISNLIVPVAHSNFKLSIKSDKKYPRAFICSLGNDGLYKKEVSAYRVSFFSEYKFNFKVFIERLNLSIAKRDFKLIFYSKLSTLIDDEKRDIKFQLDVNEHVRIIRSKYKFFAKHFNLNEANFEKEMFCSYYCITVIIQATLNTCKQLGVAAPDSMAFFGFHPSYTPNEISPSFLKNALLAQGIIRPLNPKKYIPFDKFVQ